MKPFFGITGRLRQHINKIGGANYANSVSSPSAGSPAPANAGNAPPQSSSDDHGGFSCEYHHNIFKDYCREANDALVKGDTKTYESCMNAARDFDKRKGEGR